MVDKGRYHPMKENTYYERLFVNIDENRLYYRDFWDRSGCDRRDYITDEAEKTLATNCLMHMTRSKKYRKRLYRDKADFKLLGNRIVTRQKSVDHQRNHVFPVGVHQVRYRHRQDMPFLQTHERFYLRAVLLPRLQDRPRAGDIRQIQVPGVLCQVRHEVRK